MGIDGDLAADADGGFCVVRWYRLGEVRVSERCENEKGAERRSLYALAHNGIGMIQARC
jgi:hypothetical protein